MTHREERLARRRKRQNIRKQIKAKKRADAGYVPFFLGDVIIFPKLLEIAASVDVRTYFFFDLENNLLAFLNGITNRNTTHITRITIKVFTSDFF